MSTPTPRPRHARTPEPTGQRVLRFSGKLLALAGLAVGSIAYAVAESLTDASADAGQSASADQVAKATRSALLARTQDTASRASRAGVRVAVSAPRAFAPTAAPSYGQLGVTAVAKPKPKPKPVITAATTATSTTSASGPTAKTQGSTPSASGGGAYASAGRALGLGPSAVAVYSAVRAAFGISNIGGYRAGDGGDHGTGHAVDVMITSSGQGDAVAAFVMANAGAFNVKYVIWQQRIWYPGGGWNAMADRGSPTQNHMDHVHISVN